MRATYFKWEGPHHWVFDKLVEKREATIADFAALGRLGLTYATSRADDDIDLVAQDDTHSYLLWIQK